MVLEMNLLHDNFTLIPIKIKPEIIAMIRKFELLDFPNKKNNELILNKLMHLKLSREDFISIVFYKTCLNLSWFEE